MSFYLISRKVHYYISFFILLPFFITVTTGFLLMMRHHVEAIQPVKIKTGHSEVSLNLNQILASVQTIPDLNITSTSDLKKVVMKPKKGLIEVFVEDNQHIQIDGRTGKVLKVAPRYTSLLIMLHEGVFFSKQIRDWIFLPSSFLVVFLWLTGSILLIVTWRLKLRKRQIDIG